MGNYNGITLDRDRAFDINSLNELLMQGRTVLEEAVLISEKWKNPLRQSQGFIKA